MYWTDGYNPPRKINVGKANVTNKFLEQNVYFLNSQIINGFDKTLYYRVTLQVGNTTLPTIQLDNPGASAILAAEGRDGQATVPASLQDVSRLFVELWNNNSTLFSNYEASTCNGYVVLTCKTVAREDGISISATTTQDTYSLKVVAGNYYPSGTGFREDFINRVKYPFECEPEVTVSQDEDWLTNLIQNGVFQFRTQIVYDDNEPSALSPISVIPSIPGFCGQEATQSSYNVIDVDFNVDRMNDVSVLSIIKYVNIYVRSGNLGKFGFVVSLTREQFLANENIYNFYNDGIYPEISDALSNKLFDYVPLTCQSQVLAENRLFDGGILEGYDPICINDKLSLRYEQAVVNETFNIKGKAYIKNLFLGGNFAASQPIIHQDSGATDYGFGGIGDLTVDNDAIYSNFHDYKQELPLKGFVFYLAGTNFRGVSYQQPFSGGYYFPLGNNSSDKGKRRLCSQAVQDGEPYQEFIIPNVPPGKYILRIASHLTTAAEIESTDISWQRSSTNCLSVGGVNGNECVLEVMNDGSIVIGATTYAKDAYIGNSAIADLSYPSLLNVYDSFAVCGYLCDKDTVAPTPVDVLNDTRIELATIQMDHYASGQYNALVDTFGISHIETGEAITDHNGYFFFTTWRPSVVLPTTLNIISPSGVYVNTILMTPSITKLDGSAWTGTTSPGNEIGIFRNTLDSVQTNGRTIIDGTVESSGVGVQDIVVVSTRGRVVTTDINGDYQMYVYGRAQARIDSIIYVIGDDCKGTFTPDEDPYSISISGIGPFPSSDTSPYSGNYNEINTVTTTGSILVVSDVGAFSSLKKGGKYQIGKVYYDYANRSTTTLTDDNLKLRIPFPTEPGTSGYRKGRVIVDWNIYNLPPSWATHYQWVRTLNGNQQKLLQWTAKTVTYIDDEGNTAAFDEATQVKISLSNIEDYFSIHPDSQIGYTFEEGDRLVLLKDSSGNFYTDYFDFKILGVKAGALLDIYIDKNTDAGEITDGVFFEIYNPRKSVTSEIFYEVGECFPIIENQNGIKVHGGLSVDQEYWDFDDNFYDTTFNKLGFVSTLPHDFQVGDEIVITQSPGHTFPEYNTTATILAITSTDTSGYVVVTDQPFLGSTPAEPGYIVRAAEGYLRNGDTWNRLRMIPISTSEIVGWYVEDYSISDFYSSADQSIGRPNGFNRDVGQLFRESTIRFSNTYIQDTKVNGLSNNEALNLKELPANYGVIKKLVFTKTTLLAIHENSQIVSMEVGKQTLRDTGNQQLVAVSNEVLPTDYEYQGSLGTQNPESIVVDDSDHVYGIDVNKGVAWVRQVNGLVPISEIKMATYFRDKCEAIRESGAAVRIPAVYDRGYDQVIFSFNTAGEEIGESIAFTTVEKYWESFYSFVPEYWSKGRNNEVFAFVNGEIWKNGTNALYNNFFGTQYTQKLIVVGNISPSTMKVWLNISLEGISSDIWSIPQITTLEGQESQLANGDFEFLENVWYADFLRDQNTPNVDNPLIFGDDLRSSIVKATLENSSTAYSLLYAVNIYSISSEKTNRS